ncbi:conserved hypothetical protein [delta proteobacterium NaphS2]|nr:conserved hypothetical protein [delta proteobacterium NaphS2]
MMPTSPKGVDLTIFLFMAYSFIFRAVIFDAPAITGHLQKR